MAKQNNDKIILNLKKDIDAKKKLLKSTERFTPITNCNLTLFGQRYNLNVSHKAELIYLAVLLHTLSKSAVELHLENDLTIDSWTLEEWAKDVLARLTILNRTQEEKRLKAMEEKLHNLLSTDKKVELELEELAKLIYT